MRFEFKGTKGPWKFFEIDKHCGVNGPYSDVALCSGFDTRRTFEEDKTNAKAISEVPALIEHGAAVINFVMEKYQLSSVDELTCPYMKELAKTLERATEN